MKTSNKLLLAGFLTVVLLLSALHITLYAKYKNGDYTIYHGDDGAASQTLQSFPGVRSVSIKDVSGISIRFSDAARIVGLEDDNVTFVQKGDALVITGTGSDRRINYEGKVVLNLPADATISALNSTLYLANDSRLTTGNPVIRLQRSQAVFSGAGHSMQFGKVTIVALEQSSVSLAENALVDSLDIQFSRSIYSCYMN